MRTGYSCELLLSVFINVYRYSKALSNKCKQQMFIN
nr:MAG TPA: hypothetical protein [Caudoviricetes sp.]